MDNYDVICGARFACVPPILRGTKVKAKGQQMPFSARARNPLRNPITIRGAAAVTSTIHLRVPTDIIPTNQVIQRSAVCTDTAVEIDHAERATRSKSGEESAGRQSEWRKWEWQWQWQWHRRDEIRQAGESRQCTGTAEDREIPGQASPSGRPRRLRWGSSEGAWPCTQSERRSCPRWPRWPECLQCRR
jgi:hypothetical protein